MSAGTTTTTTTTATMRPRRALQLALAGVVLAASLSGLGCRDVLGLQTGADADGGDEAGSAGSGGASSGDGGANASIGDGSAQGSGDGGSGAGGDAGPLQTMQVTTDTLVTGRTKLGALTTSGFTKWGSGLADHGGQLYWVEGGSAPGLYTASDAPCATSCVNQLDTLTRASAFYATSSGIWIADVTAVKRFPYGAGAPVPIATNTDEIVALVSDDASAFWTDAKNAGLHWTNASGKTSTPIYSNGTPVAMGLAATTVLWTGVDISGLQVVIQQMGTDGKNATETERFAEGFDVMHGNGTYLYYARDQQPVTVHRRTMSTGHEDVVAGDATLVTDFAIDGNYAYWAEAGDSPDFADGRVRRVAHDGTTPETLAVSLPHPVAIAVNGNQVWVATAGTRAAGYTDGQILRLTITE